MQKVPQPLRTTVVTHTQTAYIVRPTGKCEKRKYKIAYYKVDCDLYRKQRRHHPRRYGNKSAKCAARSHRMIAINEHENVLLAQAQEQMRVAELKKTHKGRRQLYWERQEKMGYLY